MNRRLQKIMRGEQEINALAQEIEDSLKKQKRSVNERKLSKIVKLWWDIFKVNCDARRYNEFDLSCEKIRITKEFAGDGETAWVATHRSLVYDDWSVKCGSYDEAITSLCDHIWRLITDELVASINLGCYNTLQRVFFEQAQERAEELR